MTSPQIYMPHANAQIAHTAPRPVSTHNGDAERLQPFKSGRCDECGSRVPKARRAYYARFCSNPCRDTYNRKARRRGARLYHLLMIWRRHRGRAGSPGAGMFSRVTQMLDAWHREDRASQQDQKDKDA
jgi:predicted nucleic acid-binding Zn ribbon protein